VADQTIDSRKLPLKSAEPSNGPDDTPGAGTDPNVERDRRAELAGAVRTGLLRGLQTGWFLVKIIIPLYAALALMQWTGLLGLIGRVLAPAMGLFGLPGEAAVALVSGYFAGVYGGVAAAATIPLTRPQLTVLAVMVLVAHNLVVESAVQSRSGASGLRVTAVR